MFRTSLAQSCCSVAVAGYLLYLLSVGDVGTIFISGVKADVVAAPLDSPISPFAAKGIRGGGGVVGFETYGEEGDITRNTQYREAYEENEFHSAESFDEYEGEYDFDYNFANEVDGIATAKLALLTEVAPATSGSCKRSLASGAGEGLLDSAGVLSDDVQGDEGACIANNREAGPSQLRSLGTSTTSGDSSDSSTAHDDSAGHGSQRRHNNHHKFAGAWAIVGESLVEGSVEKPIFGHPATITLRHPKEDAAAGGAAQKIEASGLESRFEDEGSTFNRSVLKGHFSAVNDFEFTLTRLDDDKTGVDNEGSSAVKSGSSTPTPATNWEVKVDSRTELVGNARDMFLEDKILEDFLYDGSVVQIQVNKVPSPRTKKVVPGSDADHTTSGRPNYPGNLAMSGLRVTSKTSHTQETASIRLVPMPFMFHGTGGFGGGHGMTERRGLEGDWHALVMASESNESSGTEYWGPQTGLATAYRVSNPWGSKPNRGESDEAGTKRNEGKVLEVAMKVSSNSALRRNGLVAIELEGLNRHRFLFDLDNNSARRHYHHHHHNDEVNEGEKSVDNETRIGKGESSEGGSTNNSTGNQDERSRGSVPLLLSSPMYSTQFESDDPGLSQAEEKLLRLFRFATDIWVTRPVAVTFKEHQYFIPTLMIKSSYIKDDSKYIVDSSEKSRFIRVAFLAAGSKRLGGDASDFYRHRYSHGLTMTPYGGSEITMHEAVETVQGLIIGPVSGTMVGASNQSSDVPQDSSEPQHVVETFSNYYHPVNSHHRQPVASRWTWLPETLMFTPGGNNDPDGQKIGIGSSSSRVADLAGLVETVRKGGVSETIIAETRIAPPDEIIMVDVFVPSSGIHLRAARVKAPSNRVVASFLDLSAPENGQSEAAGKNQANLKQLLRILLQQFDIAEVDRSGGFLSVIGPHLSCSFKVVPEPSAGLWVMEPQFSSLEGLGHDSNLASDSTSTRGEGPNQSRRVTLNILDAPILCGSSNALPGSQRQVCRRGILKGAVTVFNFVIAPSQDNFQEWTLQQVVRTRSSDLDTLSTLAPVDATLLGFIHSGLKLHVVVGASLQAVVISLGGAQSPGPSVAFFHSTEITSALAGDWKLLRGFRDGHALENDWLATSVIAKSRDSTVEPTIDTHPVYRRETLTSPVLRLVPTGVGEIAGELLVPESDGVFGLVLREKHQPGVGWLSAGNSRTTDAIEGASRNLLVPVYWEIDLTLMSLYHLKRERWARKPLDNKSGDQSETRENSGSEVSSTPDSSSNSPPPVTFEHVHQPISRYESFELLKGLSGNPLVEMLTRECDKITVRQDGVGMVLESPRNSRLEFVKVLDSKSKQWMQGNWIISFFVGENILEELYSHKDGEASVVDGVAPERGDVWRFLLEITGLPDVPTKTLVEQISSTSSSSTEEERTARLFAEASVTKFRVVASRVQTRFSTFPVIPSPASNDSEPKLSSVVAKFTLAVNPFSVVSISDVTKFDAEFKDDTIVQRFFKYLDRATAASTSAENHATAFGTTVVEVGPASLVFTDGEGMMAASRVPMLSAISVFMVVNGATPDNVSGADPHLIGSGEVTTNRRGAQTFVDPPSSVVVMRSMRRRLQAAERLEKVVEDSLGNHPNSKNERRQHAEKLDERREKREVKPDSNKKP